MGNVKQKRDRFDKNPLDPLLISPTISSQSTEKPMRHMISFIVLLSLSALAHAANDHSPPVYEPVGGANAPTSTPPPSLVIETTEMQAEGFSLRVPSGVYDAPLGGAPNYRVPGPISAFKGPDGVWRGHGYLETHARLKSFRGSVATGGATLTYLFEDDGRYEVRIKINRGVVLLDEECNLGPRNTFVFDTYYGWGPSSAFVADPEGSGTAFLYVPCHYDKLEACMTTSTNITPSLGAIAVLNPDDAMKDVVTFFLTVPKDWRNPAGMAVNLWQRRQLPGDPSSRHFLGPETKSDSTPNPRTAPLLGKSLYEGHVTIELSLGDGRRSIGFAAFGKPADKQSLPQRLKQVTHPESATH